MIPNKDKLILAAVIFAAAFEATRNIITALVIFALTEAVVLFIRYVNDGRKGEIKMSDLTKDNEQNEQNEHTDPIDPSQQTSAAVTAPQPMPFYGAPGMMFDPYAVQTAVKPKEKTVFTKTELVYSFAVFALSFLLLRFAVCSPTGFVTTIVFDLLVTSALIFMKCKGIKGSGRTALTAAVMYVFSAVYFVTDNELIKALNTVFLIICTVWLMYQYGSEDKRIPRFLPIVLVQAALEYPFENFGKMPEAVGESAKRTKLGKNISFIIIGILVTVIPTMMIGGLLMQADSGVEKMLGGISDFIFSDSMITLVVQLAVSVPIAFYVYGMFFANSHRNKEKDLTEENCAARMNGLQRVQSMIIYTALTPICILYLLFFISQANYLLSAFMDRLPDGFSHAEYARRGFFELLGVIIINIFIIAITNSVTKRTDESGKKPAALRVYTSIICFFTLVMIASALSKMVMYISVYGLSELRFYTGWFMVLCAFAFILFLVKQFKQELVIARPLTAIFVVMFALLTFGRPDHIIAMYNTELYKSGSLERYDLEYLYSLSDDAKMYCLQNGQIAESFKERTVNYDMLDKTDISTIYVSSQAENDN